MRLLPVVAAVTVQRVVDVADHRPLRHTPHIELVLLPVAERLIEPAPPLEHAAVVHHRTAGQHVLVDHLLQRRHAGAGYVLDDLAVREEVLTVAMHQVAAIGDPHLHAFGDAVLRQLIVIAQVAYQVSLRPLQPGVEVRGHAPRRSALDKLYVRVGLRLDRLPRLLQPAPILAVGYDDRHLRAARVLQGDVAELRVDHVAPDLRLLPEVHERVDVASGLEVDHQHLVARVDDRGLDLRQRQYPLLTVAVQPGARLVGVDRMLLLQHQLDQRAVDHPACPDGLRHIVVAKEHHLPRVGVEHIDVVDPEHKRIAIHVGLVHLQQLRAAEVVRSPIHQVSPVGYVLIDVPDPGVHLPAKLHVGELHHRVTLHDVVDLVFVRVFVRHDPHPADRPAADRIVTVLRYHRPAPTGNQHHDVVHR